MRQQSGWLYPNMDYADALYTLKETAAILNWPDPDTWGLHCWRRGWGREAFAAGGLAALFLSGGWKGVAAFAYLEAKQKSAIEGAEFCLNFSDDEDEY